MLVETASRIRALLADVDLRGARVANLGSGTEEFSKVRQPWIWNDVVGPIMAQAERFINVDIKVDKWVDSAELPSDASLSIVLCCSMLEHVPDPAKVIADIRASLAIGGSLLLDVPAEYPYHPDPIDNGLRIKTEAELMQLLGAGWECERFEVIQRVGFPHSAALAMVRRVA